jgi:hypothetical protein
LFLRDFHLILSRIPWISLVTLLACRRSGLTVSEPRLPGAYGEKVTDPDEVGPTIQIRLKGIRDGTSVGSLCLAAERLVGVDNQGQKNS